MHLELKELVMRASVVYGLAVGLMIGMLAQQASAKSQTSKLTSVIAGSETIAVVKVIDLPPRSARIHTATLEVLEVIKGDLDRGPHEVSFEHYPRGPGGAFVAFIDKQNNWRFTAAPLKASNNDILVIAGFRDGNVHLVSPGIVTLPQLKRYLRDGVLPYTFSGAVWFPSPNTGTWNASRLLISGTYDAASNQVSVNGLPTRAGLPMQPDIHITGPLTRFGGPSPGPPSLELVYLGDSERTLELTGSIQGVDHESGLLMCRFVVASPTVVTQEGLEGYVGNPRLRHCYYVLNLYCADVQSKSRSSHLSLTLNKEQGKIGYLSGWGPQPLEISKSVVGYGGGFNSESTSSELPPGIEALLVADRKLRIVIPTVPKQQYLILTLDLGKARGGHNTFSWRHKAELLYRAYAGPICGWLEFHDGKSVHTLGGCSVRFDHIGFTVAAGK